MRQRNVVVLESEQLGCGGGRRVAVVAYAVHPVLHFTERHTADADVTDT